MAATARRTSVAVTGAARMRPGSGRLYDPMAVTQKEIARRLGVSQTLVGVALGGRGRIGAGARAQILEAAREMGYKPNRLARALKSGRSQMVALWLPRPLGDFDAQVLEALHAHAARDGFQLLSVLRAREGQETGALPLDEWPLDGVLALDSSANMTRSLAELSRARPGLPLVAFGHRGPLRAASGDVLGDYVALDLQGAATRAMEHLVELGCENLAFVAARSQFEAGEVRLEAFRRVCAATRRKGEEIQIADSTTLRRQTHALVSQRLAEGARTDGFFCGNDDVALGTLRALRRAGIAVPGEAKIIGCDDIADAADADPPLSTIALPVEAMAQSVWHTLRWRLVNPTAPPRMETLRATFVARGTTG